MGCIIPVDRSTRITEISSTINCKIILSDIHSPFSNFMNINCVGIRTKNFHKNCYIRDTNQFVAKIFLKDLENSLQLSTVINNKHCSINSKFKEFGNLFIETVNKHALLRKKLVRNCINGVNHG